MSQSLERLGPVGVRMEAKQAVTKAIRPSHNAGQPMYRGRAATLWRINSYLEGFEGGSRRSVECLSMC